MRMFTLILLLPDPSPAVPPAGTLWSLSSHTQKQQESLQVNWSPHFFTQLQYTNIPCTQQIPWAVQAVQPNHACHLCPHTLKEKEHDHWIHHLRQAQCCHTPQLLTCLHENQWCSASRHPWLPSKSIPPHCSAGPTSPTFTALIWMQLMFLTMRKVWRKRFWTRLHKAVMRRIMTRKSLVLMVSGAL